MRGGARWGPLRVRPGGERHHQRLPLRTEQGTNLVERLCREHDEMVDPSDDAPLRMRKQACRATRMRAFDHVVKGQHDRWSTVPERQRNHSRLETVGVDDRNTFDH